MKEDVVSFEIAKKLKDNGFKKKCLYNYRNNGCLTPNYVHPINGEFVSDGAYGCCNDLFTDYTCDAPTIHQVLKWLRERKKLHVSIMTFMFKAGWCYEVIRLGDNPALVAAHSNSYNTYEKAALAGIEYVLDNLI